MREPIRLYYDRSNATDQQDDSTQQYPSVQNQPALESLDMPTVLNSQEPLNTEGSHTVENREESDYSIIYHRPPESDHLSRQDQNALEDLDISSVIRNVEAQTTETSTRRPIASHEQRAIDDIKTDLDNLNRLANKLYGTTTESGIVISPDMHPAKMYLVLTERSQELTEKLQYFPRGTPEGNDLLDLQTDVNRLRNLMIRYGLSMPRGTTMKDLENVESLIKDGNEGLLNAFGRENLNQFHYLSDAKNAVFHSFNRINRGVPLEKIKDEAVYLYLLKAISENSPEMTLDDYLTKIVT